MENCRKFDDFEKFYYVLKNCGYVLKKILIQKIVEFNFYNIEKKKLEKQKEIFLNFLLCGNIFRVFLDKIMTTLGGNLINVGETNKF